MIDPGLSRPREGIRISMKNLVVLHDKLPRAEMPPEVRISYPPRRHSEKAHREDDHKQAAGLKQLDHQSEDNTLPGIPRYKIATALRTRVASQALI